MPCSTYTCRTPHTPGRTSEFIWEQSPAGLLIAISLEQSVEALVRLHEAAYLGGIAAGGVRDEQGAC